MKLGFIGAGNMASAIIKGALSSGTAAPEDIYVYDIDSSKTELCEKNCGVNVCASASKLIGSVDAVLLAIKPFNLKSLIEEIKSDLKEKDLLIISILAGTDIAYIQSLLGFEAAIVRVMPNINATVGEAMSAYCLSGKVTVEQESYVQVLCSSFGRAIKLSENYFPAFGVLAGCSPAFVYMFIDELARSGVKIGLNKKQALEIVIQSVIGSARMIEESGEHPYELIDRVCSPGGTTIEGVTALREYGFDTAIDKAVSGAYEKDFKLKK
ncbi:MAG: pyrroline-5-carboxylate reductase [Clostridiales bacterium]|nr:pyrroline-5-carboxylate reductase [Clostridiales bacterium]